MREVFITEEAEDLYQQAVQNPEWGSLDWWEEVLVALENAAWMDGHDWGYMMGYEDATREVMAGL